MTAAPDQLSPRFPDGSITDPAQCLICHLDDADDNAVVFRDGIWACEVAPGFEVPGWYFLRTRRHALGWRELGHAELSTFGERARDLMAALEATFAGPARYLMTFGEAYPHFHCVVTTRGDDVPPSSARGAFSGCWARTWTGQPRSAGCLPSAPLTQDSGFHT